MTRWLLGISMALLLVVTAAASFFAGRLVGLREGLSFSLAQQSPRTEERAASSASTEATEETAMRAPADRLSKPPLKSRPSHLANRDRVTADGTSVTSPQARSAPPSRALPPEIGNPLGLPTLRGDEQNLEGQLGQLEGLVEKLLPGSAPVTAKPSASALQAVKVQSDSSARAILKYFAQLDTALEASGGLSESQIAALQAGDAEAQQKAVKQMAETIHALKEISVPSSCRNYHALYLTLFPAVERLMTLQRTAQAEADMGKMLEALSVSREVLALRKEIERQEQSLRPSKQGAL